MPRPSPEDMQVMAALEDGIPLERRPFATIARRLGMTETGVLERVRALLESGALKRLAVLFDSRALGFATTLAAARTRKKAFAEAVALINGFDEVTHSYRRRGASYDIWFTLTAGSARIEAILDRLRGSGLFEELLELPSEKVYKLRVRFTPGREGEDEAERT